METIYSNRYCNNCGRPSHCGIPLYEDLQNYDFPPTNIKVCDHCMCGECHTPEKDRK